jgi:hypothetical protein
MGLNVNLAPQLAVKPSLHVNRRFEGDLRLSLNDLMGAKIGSGVMDSNSSRFCDKSLTTLADLTSFLLGCKAGR